jgi:hypothetical protein
VCLCRTALTSSLATPLRPAFQLTRLTRHHPPTHPTNQQAIPILNDALAALDTIKEAEIAYMTKLTNPPGAIKLVLEAVCVALDVKPVKVRVLH